MYFHTFTLVLYYQTKRHWGRSNVLLQCLLSTLAIIFVALVIEVIRHGPRHIEFSYLGFIVPLFITASWFVIAAQRRVNRVEIHSAKRFVRVYYYDILRGEVRDSFGFDEFNVKVNSHKKNTRSVRVLAPDRDYRISKRKDAFSQYELNELAGKLSALTSLPATPLPAVNERLNNR